MNHTNNCGVHQSRVCDCREKKQTAEQILKTLTNRLDNGYAIAEEELEDYGRLCAEEAVEAKEAELRCEEAYKATMVICDEDHTEIVNGIASVRHYRSECGAGMRRVIAIATQHGMDKMETIMWDMSEKEVLEKWRATDVEEWLKGSDTDHGGTIRLDCWRCIREALAMARAQEYERDHDDAFAWMNQKK